MNELIFLGSAEAIGSSYLLLSMCYFLLIFLLCCHYHFLFHSFLYQRPSKVILLSLLNTLIGGKICCSSYAVKVLHSIYQQIWKTQQWPQDWKRSVFIPIPKKGNAKECSNYCTIALISHASKIMLNILQARLKQSLNCELPDVQAGFRKGRGTRDQIANIRWIIEKARVPEEHLLQLYWLLRSLWLCGSQQTVENSKRDGNTRPPDLPPEKSVCRWRSNN